MIDLSLFYFSWWVAWFVCLDVEEGREFRLISGKLKLIVTGRRDQLELSVNYEVGCVTHPPALMASK